jgi:hypothetical protein
MKVIKKTNLINIFIQGTIEYKFKSIFLIYFSIYMYGK